MVVIYAEKSSLAKEIAALSLPENVRGEALTLEQFALLSDRLSSGGND